MILRRLLPPVAVGRWTPSQSAAFGEAVGSVGYIGVGPLVVIFNLPTSLRRADPLPSLTDLNAYLRDIAAKAREPVQD